MWWSCYDTGRELHVVPIDDLRPHYCGSSCWCRPTPDEDDPDVLTHHALDRREFHETGRPLH